MYLQFFDKQINADKNTTLAEAIVGHKDQPYLIQMDPDGTLEHSPPHYKIIIVPVLHAETLNLPLNCNHVSFIHFNPF